MRSGQDQTSERRRSKEKKSGKTSNEIELRKIATENVRCWRFHPIREDCRINRPEIDVIEEIPGIKPVEGRLFPIQARSDSAAANKHRSGCAMVGASIGVFTHPSAKLAKGHDEYAIKNAFRPQVIAERSERTA
jgi:hypothetical protein